MAESLYQRSQSEMKMLYVFSEEASMKTVLDAIIPKIVQNVPYQIFIHQGKQTLKKR